MATRKSKGATAARESYATVPVEDRVRHLERRARRSDKNRAWEKSLFKRVGTSIAIYVSASIMLLTLLVPAWYLTAFVAVGCYWMSVIFLSLVRNVYESTINQS